MHSVDFLIIGQGLAGSLMAYELLNRGKSVLVIDKEHQGAASKVAAGLINPITGHRLNITNGFYSFNEGAIPFYKSIESKLKIHIYRELNQTRLIKNQGQFDYLQKRLQESQYQPILRKHTKTDGWFSDVSKNAFGAINVEQTAIINTSELLQGIKEWLSERNSLRNTEFDYQQIQDKNKQVIYQDISAKKIIFCEGYQALNNPWLKNLPFKTAKGEILTVKLKQQPLDRMLSWGHWLVPLTNGNFKLGSNYIWNDLDLNMNSETPNKFISSLTNQTGLEATLIEHETGIRPSTTQRIPFIGKISSLENAYCFNGLGSKGCLLAPTYTRLLADHLIEGKPIPEELTRWL